ncbi:MAG TPA: hypothetical protein VK489_04820 [Ferruginibacter sp.]|nr:hypothetical protein [Ferruginibacter sp.]
MKKYLILLTVCLFSTQLIHAQGDQPANRFTPKEFAIPAAPVFDLMGVTSSQINRTSDIKDFKVDWSFKSWRLNPNLAIQSQPVWEMLYNRKDLSKYQRSSPFMRRLASLDLSLGSVQDENNDRRIGIAFKMNVFKQRDPLMARELYAGISEKFKQEKELLEGQLKELQLKLDTTKNILEKPDIRSQIKGVEEQLASQNSRRREEINSRAKIYVEENWNASAVDLAVGKIFSYQTDSSGSLKSLRLNRSTGLGGWVNASVGIGKKLLLSGLARSSWYKEQLDFILRDTVTLQEFPQSSVAKNTLFTMGLNLRYGSPHFTFFFEFLYEAKGLTTPMKALAKEFKTPTGDLVIVASSVKWDVVNPNTLAIGGDWRVSRNLMINYGMRCVFDKNWKFTTFTPVATVSCMMR